MSACFAALNRLCKWRSILTGWHLGTAPHDAPGVAAMRDLQDFRLVVRVDVSALTALLLKKGIVTQAEFDEQSTLEANLLEAALQRSFPGYRATDEGMVINPTIARETNKAKHFPP